MSNATTFRSYVSMPYRRRLLQSIATFVLMTVVNLARPVEAVDVIYTFEELAIDGSNIKTDGTQIIGEAASSSDVFAAGVDWMLNESNVMYNGVSTFANRNNNQAVGGFAAETFLPATMPKLDRYFGTPGNETVLHMAIEGIHFGGIFDVTLNALTPDTDYRVQIVSWDAGVEGEGDGLIDTTKEYRYSIISETEDFDEIEYNQFVVDGTPQTPSDGLFGNSSDEITAALITAEFTTAVGQDSITFDFFAGFNNDNAIVNGIIVHDLSVAPTPDGDFNNDGLWDCADIDALVATIVNGANDAAFDMNGDGVVTNADITDTSAGWLAVGGANNPAATGGNAFLVGDATLDGAVDGQDFIEWNANKFTNLASWCGGDFTADGVVDGPDFIEWNANKFTGSDLINAVPEPSWSILACLLGIPWLAGLHRRSHAGNAETNPT